MAVGFKTITVYPSAAVATNGTVDFTYASGNASQWAQSGETLISSGLNDVFAQAADTFTLSYSSTKVTLTYNGATTIPAGSKLALQLPLATYQSLTDSTGGTASNTLAAIAAGASYAQSDITAIKNALASLAAKVNSLIALSADRDNIPDDDRN